MPLVEYRCTQCTQVFERLVPSTQGADCAECATCGQQTARRLLSVFATTRAEGASASPATDATSCGGGCCSPH